MTVSEFPGQTRLIEMLDAAVQQPDTQAVTQAIKQGLCRLISDGAFRLPDYVHHNCKEHYARRLLHRNEQLGYSVVAMTWGPGQGTPLHDHAGLWCVEAVCDGRIRVKQYELQEAEEGRYRFSDEGEVVAGVGTAGCLIPPHEYHTIANACGENCAVSLHIYGGDMEACNTYEPVGNGWYTREEHELGFDG